MTGQVGAAPAGTPWLSMDAWRRLFRDRPLVPLTGLLVVLVAVMELVQPGTVNPAWVGVAVRAAVPLAILGACQTLTMLTGGIDLSIGMIASMAAFIMATQTPIQGPVVAIVLALAACALVGIANGIGVGIFKVHPLIMTLGMTLVILGLLTVYQLMVVQTGTEIPDFILWLSSETTFEILPNNLIVFVPLAAVIIAGLRYSGFGRLLFAVGDNSVAARLSGVRVWQVLLALYVLSALFAGLAGFLIAGLVQTASVSLVAESVLPAVAAAVIGGTLDPGRSRRLLGHDHRSAHPDRRRVAPGGPPDARSGAPDPVRTDHRPRRGGLHEGDRRVVTEHLGIDFGATNLKWSVVERTDEAWRVLDDGQVPTLAGEGPEAVIGRIVEVGRRALAGRPTIASVGIGVPGLYDPVAGCTRFLVNMPGDWAGRPVSAPVNAALGITVALINDARAFGLAELRLGAGRGAATMIGLTLGTGVGGFIAIDGRVRLGHDGTAGEIGHQTIDPDGPSCGCGNHGCVEAYARADPIRRGVRDRDRGGSRGGGRAR